MGSNTTATEGERYCLKWNDFQKSVTSSFSELRDDESDLLDVTIVAEGKHLKAHRLILSACSEAFKDLFKSSGSKLAKDPVVMLWDVSAEDLESLFDFMYKGRVYVSQDRLDNFLALATRLQVKGLTKNSGSGSDVEEISPPKSTSSAKKPQPKRRSSIPMPKSVKKAKNLSPPSTVDLEEDSSSASPPNDSFSDLNPQKFEPLMEISVENDDSYNKDYNDEFTTMDPLPTEGSSPSMTDFTADPNLTADSFDKGPGFCPWCMKQSKTLRRHVEDLHLPSPTPCPVCGKVFASKNKMASHKSRNCKMAKIPLSGNHIEIKGRRK